MIGLQGIGGVPEPVGAKPGTVKAKETEKSSVGSSDGVSISAEAAEAAEVQVVLDLADQVSDIRQERVTQARESIEQGTYKVQDVVRQVAARLTNYIS